MLSTVECTKELQISRLSGHPGSDDFFACMPIHMDPLTTMMI